MWLALLLLVPLAYAQTEGEESGVPGEDEVDLEPLDLAQAEGPLGPPRLRAWVGARAGLALNAAPLDPSVSPGVELGLVLPILDERLRPFVGGAWNAPAADLSGTDPSLAEGWSATVKSQQGRLSAGVYGRLFGRRTPVSPELVLAPQLWLTRTVTETRGAGTVLSRSAERQVLPALGVGVGLGGDLGPGQIAAHAMVNLARSSAVLTGDASLRSTDITLAYRLEL